MEVLAQPLAISGIDQVVDRDQFVAPMLFEPLSTFVVPLADIRPESQGFPLVTRDELDRFVESETPPRSETAGSVGHGCDPL